jgi:hypothetical protein
MRDETARKNVKAERIRLIQSNLIVALLAWSQPAYAYLGPGGVVSGIGSLLALIAAVVVAVVGFVWFPIKRLLKRRKTTTTATR